MEAIDAQLDVLRNKLEGKIVSLLVSSSCRSRVSSFNSPSTPLHPREKDFEGQELAEDYQQKILWASGALAFIVGFALQSLQALLVVFALGFVACLAVTAPSYPSYNQHPITWLPTLNKFGLEESERIASGQEGVLKEETIEEDRKDR
ncbi:hypothetical protein JCM16303_003944 [Sporobolomyces ruberrimus]